MAERIRDILETQFAIAEKFGDVRKMEFATSFTTMVNAAEDAGYLYSTVPAGEEAMEFTPSTEELLETVCGTD